jgi:hypothetical protein
LALAHISTDIRAALIDFDIDYVTFRDTFETIRPVLRQGLDQLRLNDKRWRRIVLTIPDNCGPGVIKLIRMRAWGKAQKDRKIVKGLDSESIRVAASNERPVRADVLPLPPVKLLELAVGTNTRIFVSNGMAKFHPPDLDPGSVHQAVSDWMSENLGHPHHPFATEWVRLFGEQHLNGESGANALPV